MNKKLLSICLKRNKRINRSFFFVIAITCALVCGILVLSSSYDATKEENRKGIYGSWHAAIYEAKEGIIEALEEHATIKDMVVVSVSGEVHDKNGKFLGYKGYVSGESQTSPMEGIGLQLLSGRMPIEENEIAIETTYLDSLGYSYEVGQTIELDEDRYTLVGVIKNYSMIWEGGIYPCVSFFVSEPVDTRGAISRNIYLTFYNEYYENASELTPVLIKMGSYVLNSYTYHCYTNEYDDDLLEMYFLIASVICVGIVFLVAVTEFSIEKRKEVFLLMRFIGASKREVKKNAGMELIAVLLCGFLLGTGGSLTLYYLIAMLLQRSVSSGIVFAIDITSISIAVGTSMLASIIIILLDLRQIIKEKMYGNVKANLGRKRHEKIYRSEGMTKDRLLNIIVHICTWKNLAIILILSLAYFSLFNCIVTCVKGYNEWQTEEKTSDYAIGSKVNWNREITSPSISRESGDRIQYIYGIERVELEESIGYLPIWWEGCEKSEYASPLFEKLFQGMELTEPIYAVADGIAGDIEGFAGCLKESDIGEVDSEALLAGEEVILYIGSYYLNLDNGDIYPKWTYMDGHPRNVVAMMEKTLNVGDIITIAGENGNVDVRIGAIINSVSDDYLMDYSYAPYVLIGSYSFIDKLSTGGAHATYEYVAAYTDKDSVHERTDIEVSKFIQLTNFRERKEEARLKYITDLGYGGGVGLLLSIITFFMIYETQLYSWFTDIERNRFLYSMGITQKTRVRAHLKVALYQSFLAVIIGTIIVIIKQSLITGNTLVQRKTGDISQFVIMKEDYTVFEILKKALVDYFTDRSIILQFVIACALILLYLGIVFVIQNKKRE